MKITRDYILGLGSGLVICALIIFALQLSGLGVVTANSRETAGQNLSSQEQTTESEVNSNDNRASGNKTATDTNAVNTASAAPSQEIRFTVPFGSSASSISYLLEQQGIITDKQAFIDAAGRLNASNKFQTGTFALQKGLSVYEIIGILIQRPID